MKVFGLIMSMALFALANTVYAQGNMVPNGDFEELDGRVKKPGQVDLAEGWISPTEDFADLFSVDCKKEYGAPDNVYGNCDPFNEGEVYAGIRVHSDREAKPRTYLQSRLSGTLKEGKIYCVKFHVQLADLAKYGTNNLGIYVSSKAITQKDILKYEIEPQIIHSLNKVFDDQFDWQEICGTFRAKGGEKIITIGNFAPQDKTVLKKMKRPRGTVGAQLREGYFYIDDVSVYNMAEVEECDCEKVAGGQIMQVVYSQNISEEHDLSPEDLVGHKNVFFETLKWNIQDSETKAIGDVIKMMMENPTLKVEIQGHTDNIEQMKVVDDVSEKRAKAVYDFMVEKGIAGDRLSYVGMKDSSPSTDDPSSKGMAQNRRAGFVIKR